MLPFSWEENIGLIDDFIVIMSSSQKERARKLHCGRSILSPVQLMSDEKPPEPPSAPLRPYWKKSESKGWVIAMLLGFAGLIFLGALGDGASYLFYLAAIVILPIWPILLIGGIVSGGVSLGRVKRRGIGDQPPKEDATPAPEDEPEARGAMSEEEPPEPPSPSHQPDGKELLTKGCFLGAIGLICSAPFLFWHAAVGAYGSAGKGDNAENLFFLPWALPLLGLMWLLGWLFKYRPPKKDATSVASPPVPRTQSEESSNQEAEPSQPPSVPQKPDKENGCCLVLIALGLVFGLIYLIGFYFVLKGKG